MSGGTVTYEVYITFILHLVQYIYTLDLANRSGRVMSQNGFGSKWVRVKTIQLKKGLFWFGSKRVRVGTGSGQNWFSVGSGWLKNVFFKSYETQK
ncbi:hypothetical protein Hanom_Chr08g00713061 [Helianthus anomalus]